MPGKDVESTAKQLMVLHFMNGNALGNRWYCFQLHRWLVVRHQKASGRSSFSQCSTVSSSNSHLGRCCASVSTRTLYGRKSEVKEYIDSYLPFNIGQRACIGKREIQFYPIQQFSGLIFKDNLFLVTSVWHRHRNCPIWEFVCLSDSGCWTKRWFKCIVEQSNSAHQLERQTTRHFYKFRANKISI